MNMDSIPSGIYIALGAVVAAVITAIISIISSVIAKETKISELRQVWVDELRKELSTLISLINKLANTWFVIEVKTEEARKKWISENVDEIKEIDELTHRLMMRLNPKEDDELIRLIKKLEKLSDNVKNFENRDDLDTTFDLFTTESQQILKREWIKIKSGESSYRNIIQYSKITLTISLIIAASLIVVA